MMPNIPKDASQPTLAISLGRAILFSLVMTVGLLLLLELGIRFGGFVLYGFSPYYLFYGLKSWMADARAEGHTGAFDGYFKFPPSRTLHQYGMFAQPTPIRINAQGFRGKDFIPEKPPGTYRIIAMGESSTFGFYARDEHTYPATLERLFAERVPGRRVEVINAGIPDANSDNILAMLRQELIPYRPNFLTLYAGYNDAQYLMDENLLQALASWVHAHSATYVVIKRAVTAVGGPVLHSRWAKYLPRADRDHVRRQVDLHAARYRRNLEQIIATARGAGVDLVFIKQPVTTSRSPQTRTKGLAYYNELRLIRSQLDRDGWVTPYEALFLVHRGLMDTLEEVAGHHGIPLVDNIAIVNARRDYLASYVHLTEEGNRALAEALYEQIAPRLAPKS